MWVVLLAIVTVGVAIAVGSNWYFHPPLSEVSPTPDPAIEEQTPAPVNPQTPLPENIPSVVFQTPVNAPSVAPTRLLEDMEALAFDRSTDANRQRSREYILDRLTAAGWEPQLYPFEGGVNIVAERSGTDADAGAILVGAHYDTVPDSPGADDNASGVAVVLEMARLLGDRQTARSLKLAFFDREEVGLHGSLAFAMDETLRSDLRGAIVMDMVAYACDVPGCQQYPPNIPVKPPSDRGDFLAIVGDQEHMPLIEAFVYGTGADLPPVLTLPVPFKGLLMPDTLRSDHSPFWYQGIGAVLVTDTANLRSPHYHQPSDTVENIDRAFFVGSAQLVVNATTLLLETQGSLQTSLGDRPNSAHSSDP